MTITHDIDSQTIVAEDAVEPGTRLRRRASAFAAFGAAGIGLAGFLGPRRWWRFRPLSASSA